MHRRSGVGLHEFGSARGVPCVDPQRPKGPSMRSTPSHPERDKVWAMPLAAIDVSKGYLFEQDIVGFYFERLRGEDPVHSCGEQDVRPLLVGHQVQRHHGGGHRPRRFSSDAHLGGITLAERPAPEDFSCRCSSPWTRPSTTCSARPSARSSRRPTWRCWSRSIRERAGAILDSLPIGEAFDWVDTVSIELTTHDAGHPVRLPVRGPPQADLLVGRGHRPTPTATARSTSWEQRRGRAGRVPRLLHAAVERAGQRRRRGNDLISMLAHGEATRNMAPQEYLGQPDPADRRRQRHHAQHDLRRRLALNQNPDQYDKLRANPALIPSHGLRDHPLADAAGAHAPHGAARLRARRQDIKQGRQGGHVVRLGQPRRRGHRARRTTSSSTASGRASTCRSASASTAASATAWPSCS